MSIRILCPFFNRVVYFAAVESLESFLSRPAGEANPAFCVLRRRLPRAWEVFSEVSGLPAIGAGTRGLEWSPVPGAVEGPADSAPFDSLSPEKERLLCQDLSGCGRHRRLKERHVSWGPPAAGARGDVGAVWHSVGRGSRPQGRVCCGRLGPERGTRLAFRRRRLWVLSFLLLFLGIPHKADTEHWAAGSGLLHAPSARSGVGRRREGEAGSSWPRGCSPCALAPGRRPRGQRGWDPWLLCVLRPVFVCLSACLSSTCDDR